ncbi:MAG: cadherin repeat domain-containing protein [Fuerstiella sp.]|nr:cadherin repeat domain-containing protein [Fuerstiella sp.]
MDDKQRTKVLAAVLAGVVALGVLRPLVDNVVMGPVRDAQRKLDNATAEFDREELKQMQLMVAKEHISQGRAASLPPQISDAQWLYQIWITKLAQQCKFAQLDVNPGRTDNRRNQYLTVNVDVEAETDLEGLSRFLYLFEQAGLMHRIASLEIESTGSQGNPRMEILLTAEGMSVVGCPDSNDVFTRAELPLPLSATDTELTVASAKGFPTKAPFLAQVGKEMVKVTAIDSEDNRKWTVERGQEGTIAATHPDDESVQLFPVAFGRRNVSFSDYDNFLNSSPFAKPTPPRVYKPRIASVVDKTIAPGESIEMTARAEDINEDIGAPVFALENAVDGMTINSESGELEWTTGEDIEPQTYEGTVILTQNNNEDLRVEKTFAIDVKLPNDAPEITLPADAIAVLGREFILTVAAQDDGPMGNLKYSLEGDENPEGMAFGEDGNILKWTAPRTFSPGEYPVKVKVTDGGEPAMSAVGTLTLKVTDDTAALTRFTGAVGLDGRLVAWFWNQAENKKPELQVGDWIVAADIDAELVEIAKRHIMMKDAEGIWKLSLGQNLRERVLTEPATKPTPTDAVETPAGAKTLVVSDEAPVVENPTAATEEPAAEEPAAEEPATEEPATEEPATEEPATEEPATEEPTTEEPTTEEPTTEEPAAEEPTAEEPAAEEPAAEEPTAEETTADKAAEYDKDPPSPAEE